MLYNINIMCTFGSRIIKLATIMKKRLLLTAFVLLFSLIGWAQSTLNGKFSVSSTKQVFFSKGNLQYVDSEWKFAEHQYDYFGTDQSSNHKDMFAFNAYTCPAGWYCLSNAEWTYLLATRDVSNSLCEGARYTLATLGGTYKGMIVFPDNYNHPVSSGFTAGTYNTYSNYSASVSLDGWAEMEKAGAMFLPCAGYKSLGSTWKGVHVQGCYMTTTSSGGGYYDPWFDPTFVSLTETSNLSTWSSVRLVRDTEDEIDKIVLSEELRVMSEKSGSIYNLVGQRLGKMQKGINIVDGKKIIVK